MVKLTDRPAMTIAVDMGRKATKTNKTCSELLWSNSISFSFLFFFFSYKGNNSIGE